MRYVAGNCTDKELIAPVVSLTSINGIAVTQPFQVFEVGVGSSLTVQASATSPVSQAITQYWLAYTTFDGGVPTTVVLNPESQPSWTFSSLPDGRSDIRVTAQDSTGERWVSSWVTVVVGEVNFAAATFGGGSDTATATVTSAGGTASLTLSGTAGQRILLEVTNGTVGSAYVSITNPDGTLLVGSIIGNSGLFNTIILPATGLYTLVMDPSGTSTRSLTFTLHDMPQNASAVIEADSPPVTVTVTVSGQIATATFYGTAGQRVFLERTNNTMGGANAIVKIWNPDGTALAGGYALGPIDTVTLATNGIYSITADPPGTTTGSITLTLHNVPADVIGTIGLGGPGMTATIPNIGQNGYWTFSGTAGQRVYLQMTNNLIGETSVKILHPNGTTLATAIHVRALVCLTQSPCCRRVFTAFSSTRRRRRLAV